MERQLSETKIEINKEPQVWRSGCLTVNRGMVKYLTGYLLCIGVITFSGYQLTQNHACEWQQLYTSLISLIVGAFIRGVISS